MPKKIWHRAPKPIYDLAVQFGLKTKKDGIPPLERYFVYASPDIENALYSYEPTFTEVEFMGKIERFEVEKT